MGEGDCIVLQGEAEAVSRAAEAIEYLKKVILAYNGGADAYGNIIGVYVDAGSGGGRCEACTPGGTDGASAGYCV